MDFIAFARAHGILIDRLPQLGVWRRYPTEDHPHKRNGAVRFLGEVAFVQNWAMSTEVHVWKAEGASQVDLDRYRRDVQAAERKRKQQQLDAAKKAQWILAQCQIAKHPYLAAKGFPDDQAYVWKSDDGLVLVIPMRVGHQLVGCQLIREDGAKKFLHGQITSKAEYLMSGFTKGIDVLVEGYATGLAVKKAMEKINNNCRIHVCFSAHNLAKIADGLPTGFIVADHDESQTGELVAKKIGWPFYLPPDLGFDFNDHFAKYGLTKARMDLKSFLLKVMRDGIINPFR